MTHKMYSLICAAVTLAALLPLAGCGYEESGN